jgi:hypothetical protein
MMLIDLAQRTLNLLTMSHQRAHLAGQRSEKSGGREGRENLLFTILPSSKVIVRGLQF